MNEEEEKQLWAGNDWLWDDEMGKWTQRDLREERKGRGRKEKGMERWRLISLRKDGTLSFHCSTISSRSILSPFVLQKYLSGWEREGESYSKLVMTEWGGGSDRGSRWLWEGLKTFSTTKQVCNINPTIITKHTEFPTAFKGVAMKSTVTISHTSHDSGICYNHWQSVQIMNKPSSANRKQ